MGTLDPSSGTGRELWLFTIRFPFGNGESFIENELPILARGFERIRLFPLMPDGPARPIPGNAEVTNILGADAYRPASLPSVLMDLRRWLHVVRTSKASVTDRSVWKARRRELYSRLRQAMRRERILLDRFGDRYDPERVVLYSYWTSDWATVLGLWKLRDPRVRFVSRMMGFDMFDHRAKGNWQMLQAFHVEQVDRIFNIARAGQKYMGERHPHAREKFMLSPLATVDHGPAPWAPSPILRIASCANLIPLKRVGLLVEALARLTIPVKWTHFGDGEERSRIEALVRDLPPIIEVELKGSRPNSEVIQWYKANPVDVFVHTSSTEGGAPVALQEAASFGIPLLAADAGGVNEIVTPWTGVLLPHAVSVDELESYLYHFRNSTWYQQRAREQVREFWRAHFEAEVVHGRLLEFLLRS
ncbi:MAG TPA: glycosyltransferase [Flavobacteriales bacterium]|nr:glycosyltransferase [Flavobacteriales bacterium]